MNQNDLRQCLREAARPLLGRELMGNPAKEYLRVNYTEAMVQVVSNIPYCEVQQKQTDDIRGSRVGFPEYINLKISTQVNEINSCCYSHRINATKSGSSRSGTQVTHSENPAIIFFRKSFAILLVLSTKYFRQSKKPTLTRIHPIGTRSRHRKLRWKHLGNFISASVSVVSM